METIKGELDKLADNTPNGAIGMWLAVNISDKFTQFPDREQSSNSIGGKFGVPVNQGSALLSYWDDRANRGSLLKMWPKFWYWKYPYAGCNNHDYNVLVLTCCGKRLKGHWEKI
jgi:hypothetical protein